MADRAPLQFEARLGGLFPANAVAEEAMREVRGKVNVKITGGKANQRRRGLYWAVCSLVVPLLNDLHGLTLDEDDLHKITKTKLKLYDEQKLPSGEVYQKLRSTSNRAMNEAERADYTNRAIAIWSTWIGVDAHTLSDEAKRAA